MNLKLASDSQYNYLRDLLAARTVEQHGVTDVDALFASLRAQGADTRLVSKMIDAIKALPCPLVRCSVVRCGPTSTLVSAVTAASGRGRRAHRAQCAGRDTLHLVGSAPPPPWHSKPSPSSLRRPAVPAGRYAVREGGVVSMPSTTAKRAPSGRASRS
jgi:hypothetical protein